MCEYRCVRVIATIGGSGEGWRFECAYAGRVGKKEYSGTVDLGFVWAKTLVYVRQAMDHRQHHGDLPLSTGSHASPILLSLPCCGRLLVSILAQIGGHVPGWPFGQKLEGLNCFQVVKVATKPISKDRLNEPIITY